MKRILSFSCLFVFCLLVASAVVAQELPTGSLVGTVTDPQGAAVVGAKVLVKDMATGASVPTVSGDGGRFSVANLSPSNYSITVTMANFKTAVITNVTIEVGKTYTVPIKLELGQTSVTVEVTGGGEQLVEAQSTAITNVVSGKSITDLPFNSRSAVLLAVLDPGTETSGGTRNSAFEGLPKGSINITFDGINVQCNLLKSSDGFFAINDPRVDDVAEFAITTGVNSPDKAGEGAIQMNYVSNKGGDSYHGGVWEYNRNTDYDANTYFNNLNGLPRQTLQLNDWGFKVGGPILKNKLFFYADMDNFTLPAAISRSHNILTPGATGSVSGFYTYQPVDANGNPSLPTLPAGTMPWVTCNGNASNPLCTVNLFLLAQDGGYPHTTSSVVAPLVNAVEGAITAPGVTVSPTAPSLWQETINFENKGTQTRRYPDGRIDYNINKHNSLELDYHYAHYTSSPDILNGMDSTFPVAPFNGNQGSQISNRSLIVAAWRWTIGSSASNELRAGIATDPINFGVGINSSFFPSLQTNLGSALYTYGITGDSSLFNGLGDNQGRNTAYGQLIDNFSWTKGTHNLTFGISTTQIYYNDFFRFNANVGFGIDNQNDPIANVGSEGTNGVPPFSGGPGSCTTTASCAANGALPNIADSDFSNAEGLYASLTGRVTSFSDSVYYSPTTGGFLTGSPQVDKWRQSEWGIYGADSWRIKPTLTFNYGLRWEYSGAPRDVYNEYFFVDDGTAGLFGPSGTGNLFQPGTLSGPQNTFLENDKGMSTYNPYLRALAPSVGLAWQPHSDGFMHHILGDSGKTVVRAGYSIAYSREGLEGYMSTIGENLGFFGSQFANSFSSNDQSQGEFAAGSVVLANSSVGLNQVLQNPLAFTNQVSIVPSDEQGINGFDPNIRPPLIQSWSAGIQREISTNNAIEIRYQANHGSGLWEQFNLNEVNIFENGFLNEFNNAANNLSLCNSNAAACLAAEQDLGVVASTATTHVQDFGNLYSAATQVCSGETPPASCAQSIAALAGQTNLPIFTAAYTASTATTPETQTNSHFTSSTYITPIQQGQAGAVASIFSGTLSRWENIVAAGYPTNFFVTNPNVPGGSYIITNAAQSTYNAGIIDFRRRPSHGLQFDLSYVYAKALTNYQANSSLVYNQPTTFRNLGYDKGPAPFDIRNAIKGQLIYFLPFGSGRKWLNTGGVVTRVFGGWSIDTITRWQTGTPINIQSGLNGSGGTFNQNDSGVVLNGLTVNQLQSMLGINKTADPGAVLYFPTSLLDSNLQKPNATVLQPCETPGALCQKLFVYGPQFFDSNISLVKTTKITERVNLELRVEALDIFNNANFYYACGSGATPCSINLQSTVFGKIAGDYSDFNTNQDPGGRIIQLVGRVNF